MMTPLNSDTPQDRRREFLTGAALFVVSLAWFWFWRTRHYTGGDSGQWDRTIYEGWWLQRRQMLSFVSMQLSFKLTHTWFGWTSMMAISLVSCISGASAVVILWRFLKDQAAWGGALLAAATAGFTVLYYGHIETYAMSVTAMLFHLLAVKRTLEKQWAPWTVMATFCLMLGFHLIALFILPVAMFVAVLETKERGLGRRGYAQLALASSPALIVWLVGFSGFISAGFDEAVKQEFFVAPPGELIFKPWLVFTHTDARGDSSFEHKVRFMLVNAGLFALLIPWVFYRFRRERLAIVLAADFVLLLIWSAAWSPLQYAADFDLFCFPWVIGVLLVALHVGELRGRAVWLGLLLGVNVVLFMARPAVFSDLGRRGTASISVAPSPFMEETTVFLDESFKLPVGTYRNLPPGAHLITIRRKGWPKIRRSALIEAGESWRIEVGDESLRVLQD